MFDPVDLTFRMPIGVPVPATVVDATASLTRYTIRIRVDRDTWTTIDDAGLFHLSDEARHPGAIELDGPVDIELRLADALVADTVSTIADLDPADGVARLASLDTDTDVLVTENWFATTVTEEVPLPEELADSGEVRQGFTTTWNDADRVDTSEPDIETTVEVAVPVADEPWPPLLDQVRRYLDDRGIAFERHARADMVSADIEGENGDWSMWLHTREDSRQVVVYSIRPDPIDADRRAAAAELATRLNSKMFSGTLEVDLDDGGFRCRTSLNLNDSDLTDDLIAGLVEANVAAIDAALPALDEVLAGGSPVDAVGHHPPTT